MHAILFFLVNHRGDWVPALLASARERKAVRKIGNGAAAQAGEDTGGVAPPDRTLARRRRDDRTGADHGRAARGASVAGAARGAACRPGAGVDLRQSGTVRTG